MTGDYDSPTGDGPGGGAGGDDFRIEGVQEDSLALTDALVADPTVRLWKTELSHLAHGERRGQLYRVGNAGAYVRNLLDAMGKGAAGSATFSEALSEFVQEWQPWAGEDEEFLFNMLTLIGAFTPPVGFTRVAGYLLEGDWSGLSATPAAGVGVKIDLQMKALVTLRSYFKTAPLDESSSAFKTYLGILGQHLTRPPYFGYAAAQLLALGRLDTADAAFAAGVRRWPESLREIIPTLLSPRLRETASRDLGRVYNCCRPQGSPACCIFEDVVRERGGVVSRDHQPAFIDGREDDFWEPEPVILLADGSRIEVTLSPEQMVAYVESREPAALPPLRHDLLEEYGQEVAMLMRLIEGRIIHFVDTVARGDHSVAFKSLQEQLVFMNATIMIDPDRNRAYTYLKKNAKSIPLNLPDEVFDILMRIYFSPRSVTVKELLSKANTG